MKKLQTIPKIKMVEVIFNDLRYRCMPIKGYRGLYPGQWKCGKCNWGIIRPEIGLWDAPQCRVCKAYVKNIYYNDHRIPTIWSDKVFTYSFEPK